MTHPICESLSWLTLSRKSRCHSMMGAARLVAGMILAATGACVIDAASIPSHTVAVVRPTSFGLSSHADRVIAAGLARDRGTTHPLTTVTTHGAVAQDPIPTAEYVEQPQDHFNTSNTETWQQVE
jgi:hypothetical protein